MPGLLQVPALWDRPPEAALSKLQAMSSELSCDVPAAAALLMAVPSLHDINMPGIVRDRMEALAAALAVSVASVSWVRAVSCTGYGVPSFCQAVLKYLVMPQRMLWVVLCHCIDCMALTTAGRSTVVLL